MGLPRIFVMVQGQIMGDVTGGLYGAEGQALWAHISSSMSFLKSDLTVGFAHRRDALNELYPDGYEVSVIEGPGKAYDELTALWDLADPDWREKAKTARAATAEEAPE